MAVFSKKYRKTDKVDQSYVRDTGENQVHSRCHSSESGALVSETQRPSLIKRACN